MSSIRLGLLERAIQQCLAPLSRRRGTNQSIPLPTLAVALSGGLDSMVLLQALANFSQRYAQSSRLPLPLYAFHIHHGLQRDADQWAAFCQTQAERRGFVFACRQITLNATPAEGIEAAARKARYAELNNLCHQYDVGAILTAHHQDDQAETVLLQLLRGAGIAGLTAMSAHGFLPDKKVSLLRPFLSLSREQLNDYALQSQISNIEDSSNHDYRYARNALRHDIMPRLATVRAGYRKGLARSAQLLSEANDLLDDLARLDLGGVGSPQIADGEPGLDDKVLATAVGTIEANSLSCTLLRGLNDARARNVLRYWLRSLGLQPPSRAYVDEVLKQALSLNPNTRAGLYYEGHELRVWRGRLWLFAKQPLWPTSEQIFSWSGQARIEVSPWRGTFEFCTISAPLAPSGSLVNRLALLGKTLRVMPRIGGERFRGRMAGPSCSLQHAYQQQNVPPWLRQGPLLYLGEQLLFVAHLGFNYPHSSGLSESSSQSSNEAARQGAVNITWHSMV